MGALIATGFLMLYFAIAGLADRTPHARAPVCPTTDVACELPR